MAILKRSEIMLPVMGLILVLVSSGYGMNGIVSGASFDSHYFDVAFYGSAVGCICAVWPVLRKAHIEGRKARIPDSSKTPLQKG